MALTATVTKVGVSEPMDKLWKVNLQLELKEGEDVVLTRSFTQDYSQGGQLSELGQRFLDEMQPVIDRYKREANVLAHADLDTVVAGLNSNLEV